MQRREFMRLFTAAAMSAAIPLAARDAIIAQVEAAPAAEPGPSSRGWYRAGRNRLIQWGEFIMGDDGAEVVTFPRENYSTLAAKAQSSDVQPVLISSITRDSMRVFAAPGVRVMWIAVGEIHDGRSA